MYESDLRLRKIKLFLIFLRGDTRIPDAFRWSSALRMKIEAFSIFYKLVLDQIPKCLQEISKMNKIGYGTPKEYVRLIVYYEAFLNSIYMMCENISWIVAHLYSPKNLPRFFHDQKNKFISNPDFDPDYARILGTTKWYDEIHSMRTEATHYLTGFVTIESSTKLGYINIPKSKRKGTLPEILIKDIKEHVNERYNDLLEFMFSFVEHFKNVIDQDARIALPCETSSGFMGSRTYSFREYINGEKGVCNALDFDCPEKNSCKARKKI